MKIAKCIIVVSFIISLLISATCFINALMYEIDAYDFGYIYSYLNPSKIFFLTAIILLIMVIVLSKRKDTEIQIDKLFAVIYIVVAIGFGAGYISSNFGNDVYSSKAFYKEREGSNFETTYDLRKKYLPFYDEYTNFLDEKGEYEIYKGDLKSTVMIYVNSEIIGQENNMYYELEFLKTKNPLTHAKLILQRLYFDKTSIAVEGSKSDYSIDDCKISIYKYGSSYAASVCTGKEFLYITLTNAKSINEQDFVNACVEQYDLMQKTIAEDKLLI